MPAKHPAKNCHCTDGVKKFVRLIKQAVGDDKEFYPVHRSLSKNDDFLYSKLHDKKAQMLYESCDGDTQETAKGMRVKLTFTLSGAGQVFAPYVTVTGLAERELSKDKCPS
eukprot:7150784-Ditylum_brightwellii.AAC.1